MLSNAVRRAAILIPQIRRLKEQRDEALRQLEAARAAETPQPPTDTIADPNTLVDLAVRRALAEPRSDSAEIARRLLLIVSLIVVAAAVLIAVISLFYTLLAYPQVDDLERTAAMRALSPWQRVQGDYFKIDGRWASLFIQYLLYTGGHVVARYPVMLSMLLLVGMAGCCCGVAIVSGRRISDAPVLAGAICTYAFLWLSAPRGEPFYWFPAGMGYWLPVALGMMLLWILCAVDTWWAGLTVISLAALLPALHEICGAWVVGVLAVVCLSRVIGRRPGVRTAACATLVGLLSTASVVLAPAIRVRMASTPHQSLLASLMTAWQIDTSLIAHWKAIIAVLAVIVLAAARSPFRPVWYRVAPRLTRISLALAIVPGSIVVLTIVSSGLGGIIPPRVFDGIYFLLAAAIATFATACGFDLGGVAAVRRLLDGKCGLLLSATMVVLALGSTMQLPRFAATFRDLEPAIRNRAAWDRRNLMIWAESRAGVRDVVTSICMIPLTILPTYFDITDNPDWVANEDLRAYYSLHSLRLAATRGGCH